MTERGFHPFAVLHFLRKTILLYLLPLLQVLFARNWAALRTALVQGAALLTVLAAVSAAVLHAGRWRVDAQGTLRVRWRLGVRLDRCLKASQLAALTIERPLLYRLAGASRVVLYPAGQKRTLTLLLSAQNAQFLADRMMPRRDAVAHTPRGGEKLAFAVLGANGLSTLALLALAIKQSRPYAPDAQTAAFAHLNRIAAWAARWLPMGTAWLLVLGGVLFCASLVRSAAHAAHYTVWRTESHLGSRGGFVHRYEMRLALEHLSYADLRRSPATWALGSCPVFVTAGSCQPEIPLLVWREDGPFLQELLPGFVLPPKAWRDTGDTAPPVRQCPPSVPDNPAMSHRRTPVWSVPAKPPQNLPDRMFPTKCRRSSWDRSTAREYPAAHRRSETPGVHFSPPAPCAPAVSSAAAWSGCRGSSRRRSRTYTPSHRATTHFFHSPPECPMPQTGCLRR